MYVDDILIANQSIQEIAQVKSIFSGAFEMKDVSSIEDFGHGDQEKNEGQIVDFKPAIILEEGFWNG